VLEAQELLAMSALKVMMEQPHPLLVLVHLLLLEVEAREAFGPHRLTGMMAVVVVVAVTPVVQAVQVLQAKGMTEVEVIRQVPNMAAVVEAVLER
tara:strand:+ start:317 stop:601 length:285 start_codon:yes stop_codon:yes gene_type:complete